MFGTNTIGSTLSLGKVLNGISRTLSIANQVIPLYQQVKPMIGSARKVMSVLQELKVNNNSYNTNNSTSNNKTTIEVTPEEKKTVTYESQSAPVFFQ